MGLQDEGLLSNGKVTSDPKRSNWLKTLQRGGVGRGGPPWGSPTPVPVFHSDPHREYSTLLLTHAPGNLRTLLGGFGSPIFSSVTWEGENLLRK